MHFYTGLKSYAAFQFVLSTLGPAIHHLNYYDGSSPPLDLEDQFFFILIKLRRRKTNYELSILFRLSVSRVMSLFCHMGQFHVRSVERVGLVAFPRVGFLLCTPRLPSRVPYNNGHYWWDGVSYYETGGSTGNVLDFQEAKHCQSACGMYPGGAVSYVLEAYCGSPSDRQICEQEELPRPCDAGDSVMADKGNHRKYRYLQFNIHICNLQMLAAQFQSSAVFSLICLTDFNVQNLFIPYDMMINIPTFFRKKNRISSQTVLKDRKLASKRVHVERITGLAKTFKILTSPLSKH